MSPASDDVMIWWVQFLFCFFFLFLPTSLSVLLSLLWVSFSSVFVEPKNDLQFMRFFMKISEGLFVIGFVSGWTLFFSSIELDFYSSASDNFYRFLILVSSFKKFLLASSNLTYFNLFFFDFLSSRDYYWKFINVARVLVSFSAFSSFSSLFSFFFFGFCFTSNSSLSYYSSSSL